MRILGATLAACVAVPAAIATTASAQTPVENGRIAFSGMRGDVRTIYSRERNGTALRRLRLAGWMEQPAFSRRGRRVAFTLAGAAGRQLWVSELDGDGLRRLTGGPADDMADWAPEGERLVFARGARGARDIYRVTLDGSRLRQLSFHAGDEHSPSWSPDGRIAFVRRTGAGDDIYVFDAAATIARRLTDDRRADQAPAWSPSGRVLAIARGRSGRRNLWLVRADGTKERRLTRIRGDENEPVWSPDGTRIAFIHRRAGKRRLYIVKVRGKAVRKLRRRGRRTRQITSARSNPRQPSWQATGFDPVIAAAADIACSPRDRAWNGGEGRPGVCRQLLTSNLLLRPDLHAVLALGDLQYPDGELRDFLAGFEPSWGRAKHMMRPVPGNHEYNTPHAAGYFDYFNGPGRAFGRAGARGQGYYSFDIAGWHLIALNSECEFIGGCGANSPQMQFLRDDLAANPARCTLAYWHRPTFTSGDASDEGRMVPAWHALYGAGADVILVGHEHFYERFAPQTPTGGADPARGIRQFIAGMGGRSRFDIERVAPNSERRDDLTIGVLELTLRADGYDWRLRSAADGGVNDSGSGACH